jgi:hypothetical protein
MSRKEKLKEVYEYVRAHFNIHTQSGFADVIKYNRAYISSAMNGNGKYLTDSLFKNICEAFPGVFNLDYLLTGEGSLLLNEKPQQTQKMEQTADILELYAQRVRLVDDLRQTLKEELEEVRTIRAELLQARNDFRDATYRLTQALRTLSPNSTLDIAAEEK